MASIIIHLDTSLEEDVIDAADAIRAVLGLLTAQSSVRSSMYAPHDLTDAAFDGRLQDVLDYVKDLSTEPNNAVEQPVSGKLVFAEPGVIVDTHQELAPADRYVTVWGETEWFERVKLARFDSTPGTV